MTKRENLPAKLASQGLAATTEKRGSLVARGLEALQNFIKLAPPRSNDDLYHHARTVFDQSGVGTIFDKEDTPALLAAYRILQQLADQNYGKAYYPLSIIYGECQSIEDGQSRAKYYSRMAFDWCFANQAKLDVNGAELGASEAEQKVASRLLEMDS